ncbi:hypothetical protein LV779_02245 [Streptomyces thinghirensis]|nr:hypothetical protein [Streptomyces thinghirensis]
MCGAALESPTLRQIGDWLRQPHGGRHPILQDGVHPVAIQSAFRQAGLSDLPFEPDAVRTWPWPKLGDTIDSARRLVVRGEGRRARRRGTELYR